MASTAAGLYFPGLLVEKHTFFPEFWQRFQGWCLLAQLEACDHQQGSHWSGLGRVPATGARVRLTPTQPLNHVGQD